MRTRHGDGEQPRFVDPRLQALCQRLRRRERLEAVVIAHDSMHGTARRDVRGAAGPVVDAVARRLRRQPEAVRYLRRGRLAIVTADVGFIRALMEEPRVAVLSATDTDRLC